MATGASARLAATARGMIDPAAWDAFVDADPRATYLQASAWAAVKAANGWRVKRVVATPAGGTTMGAQVLLRRPRIVPWSFGYAPRGPLGGQWDRPTIEAWTEALRSRRWGERVAQIRIDPEIEADGPLDAGGALRAELARAGWRAAPSIQPSVTRVVDLSADEAALWSDLRGKWRQYVNKARSSGVTVVDADEDRLAEFHAILTETAQRAGTRIRAASAYRDIWDAFRPSGRARLLLALGPDGDAQAALLLVRSGSRVVEPYGGMTAAGAASRANYLIKWEAIRSSREAGATAYDMWGLVHPGIRQFKAGFGGREITYIGGWELALDQFGTLAYRVGTAGSERVAAIRLETRSRRRAFADPRSRRRAVSERLHEATESELADWDARTVEAPGGDVEQSLAWGRHRARLGWRPRHLVFEDGFRVLTLERAWPLVGGAGAYISHGPIPAGEPAATTAGRLRAVADHLAASGVDVVSSDAEIEASTGYGDLIERDGFRPIEEARSSRHRMRLALPPGTDEEALFDGFQTTLRQLIRGAQKAGLTVAEGGTRASFQTLYGLLAAAATRRQFRLGPRKAFVEWSLEAMAAGHLVYLEVHDPNGDVLGGATFYRHGGRLTYSHSGDRVEVRRQYPGVVRLLLWNAIQMALREGLTEMDLGGVDVAGARRVPVEGEPMYGLYMFKRSFGAEWVEQAGNHEWVARPWRYAAGRVTGKVAALARRGSR